VLPDKCGLERTASGFILIALAGATHNSFKAAFQSVDFIFLIPPGSRAIRTLPAKEGVMSEWPTNRE
jgi:hypothetical protein